jgi:phosphoribosylaminoimidazole carboxylase PurE protein
MKLTFLLGSKMDVEFAEKIAAYAKDFGVPSQIIVASAHKVPEKVAVVIDRLNADTEPTEPTVVIAVVGMSNGLAGVMAGGCVHPVIACPPFKDLADYQVNVHSSLQMPSDVPVMTVLNPKNAGLAALRILAEGDADLRKKLLERIAKIKGEYTV